MNRLSQIYIADTTALSKDGCTRDDALRMISKHGEIVRVEDVPWEYAYRQKDPEKRKYCFTREYQFEDGIVTSHKAKRAGIPHFEPLEENPIVLDATENTKAA